MATLTARNLTIEFPVLTRGVGAASVKAGGGDSRFVTGSNGKPAVRALSGVSFSLQAGDRLALVGLNGAGKSTLLLALAGIIEPTKGAIEVDGRLEALFNPRLGFKPEATGRRNVYLRGLVRGWTREQIDSVLDDVIEFSELGEFIDMPLRSYSQGMAARLAFAASTAFAPDILLMDEWIGAGDKSFQKKAAARMDEFIARTGIVVIASHNEALLRRLCNKALRLDKGRFVGCGDIGNILGGAGSDKANKVRTIAR